MMTMYGYDVKSFEDPCIVAAEGGITAGTPFLVPGGTLINTFPILAKIKVPLWLPGASTWRIAARIRDFSHEMQRIPYEFAKKAFVSRPALVLRVSMLNGHQPG